MDPQKIIELANLLRNNGDKILNSEFTLTLSGSLLRALNDAFTLITDAVDIGGSQSFQVVKPNNSKSPVFRDLQLIFDFVQKTALLCIVHYPTEEYFEGSIDISKFRALRRLEVQKTNVKQIVGIQRLRSQLQQLICVKSLQSVEDIITHCGGDRSNGFVWNELKVADFSYNNLKTVDTSLEFAQYLQHLNLRHNQLHSVEAIKWLPNLKTLDLSFNCLQAIPQLHMEAYKRLQSLNMSNNFVEDLLGITKLDALTDLDLSDNCLLDHSYLLPLSTLMTLKFLNLYGNPLYCHPKHRLATAQFLHKNTATVQFILDFEPLSKNEKAITGSQQMRPVGSLSRFAIKSSAASISSERTTPMTNTPSSSVGSLRSFRFQDSSTDVEPSVEQPANAKRKSIKARTVEIEDIKKVERHDEQDLPTTKTSNKPESRTTPNAKKGEDSLQVSSEDEHLEAKKHVENLREKFGEKWLQSGNAEMLHSALGIESNSTAKVTTEEQREMSRQLFDDYLGEFSMSSTQNNSSSAIKTSTPKDSGSYVDTITPVNSTNGSLASNQNNDTTLYNSLNTTIDTTGNSAATLYKSANETVSSTQNFAEHESNKNPAENIDLNKNDELEDKFKNIYSTAEENEPDISDAEDDEETYIVYTSKRNEAIFLTLSSNFLREKDTLTQRTKTKWSLKILESCDRIKSNTLRINFDTVKVDKQERVYTVEDGLCQELEKKLRDILSQRDLSEMNQTIYRCVNCSCQFSIENKFKQTRQDIRCPDCRSTFVAEVQDISRSLEKTKLAGDLANLSPAAVVEESPITAPLILQSANGTSSNSQASQEAISQRISGGEAPQSDGSSNSNSIGSANSLNDSSSCSKITPTSQSSFDSNQSVAGSSNTERDLEFNVNGDGSDVDIISNPSQSSIEVLDHQNASRKTSEERRILQYPNLETIDDTTPSYTHSFIEREFQNFLKSENRSPSGDVTLTQALIGSEQLDSASNNAENLEDAMAQGMPPASDNSTAIGGAGSAAPTAAALAHFQLTESSSSGSVTDSICTAYEQQQQHGNASSTTAPAPASLSIVTEQESAGNINLLASEREGSSSAKGPMADTEKKGNAKKDESGLTSMFGALFQSTNVLMSSSKKLLDAELGTNVQQGQKLTLTSPSSASAKCAPYKFNYQDFNDIDHRLKLYFYQTKFEDAGEHFKWIVRGRIYNENTRSLYKDQCIIVMSTSRLYFMEATGPEHDDVSRWLRLITRCSVDRLEWIQLLPWKLGLTFCVRDFGNLALLLQDIIRTDSLLLYFTNNNLPVQCEICYQPAEIITQRLYKATEEKPKICAILNGCEISCDNAKRTLSLCILLATDSHLYLSTGSMHWLSQKTNEDNDLEICVTQLVSNLVEVVNANDSTFTLSFLDETQNKSEVWTCAFETKDIAQSCLSAISASWEELFGVPFTNA